MRDRVLVTGAAGFVGRAAVDALVRAGHRVIGTYRSEPPAEQGGVRWLRCDLSDRRQVADLFRRERPGSLMALAWHMGPGHVSSAENYRWIGYSIDVLFAFAENGGRRVVQCGSCAEYDWTGTGKLKEDETPLGPSNDYGRAKLTLGGVFPALCRKLDLSGAWARPFFMYGPREDPNRLVSSVILALLAGRPAQCTTGTQRLDFLQVDDVGAALTAVLEADDEGAINIASGKAVAVREVIAEIADQIGRPDLVEMGARPSRPDEPPMIEADTGRLSGQIRWRPKFDLHDGIAGTIAWWHSRSDHFAGQEHNDA